MNTVSTSSPGSTGSAFALHAWVDESIHNPGDRTPGMYVLAAVVADPTSCDGPRQALTALLPRGRDRLHWRNEDEPLRRKITATIASCDLASVVVVGVALDPGRQERARRQCMRRLLYEMDQLGVSQVWLEARTSSLNKKDMFLIDQLRGEQAISKGLRVDLGRPLDEPMLWIPDAIAGAVSAARKGGVAEHRQTLGSLVDEIDLTL